MSLSAIIANGQVSTRLVNGVLVIEFSHPKANSLPLALLHSLAAAIKSAGENSAVSCVVLQSTGEGCFCAGASFDEFQRIETVEGGAQFFMGFAKVILALRACPKLVIARVQGKVVGGGVGLVAACDYAFGQSTASMRLSEFELGIGPFTVGPAIERKIGSAAFAAMAIDAQWRSAQWCWEKGLLQQVRETRQQLDQAVEEFSIQLSQRSLAASAKLKEVLWANTESWLELLPERAKISGELLIAGKRGSGSD